MFSRQESSKLRQEFWTTLGQYMSPIPSAEGVPVNWINYKTGEPSISFKMDADNKTATISVLITNNDPGIRELYFDQLVELKNIFNSVLGNDWVWQKNLQEGGRQVSRIYVQITGTSIFNRDDWPTLITFFKEKMIGLDEFWSNVKIAFETLR